MDVGSGAGGSGAIVWRSVAREEARPVAAGRGGYEAAPAVLGRVLPGGPTWLPVAATTVVRSAQVAVAGVLAGARTDRVAPPRMSVAAPAATLDPPPTLPTPPMPAGSSSGFAAETRQPGLGPLQPVASHPAASHPVLTTDADTAADTPADTAAPGPASGSAPPIPPGGGEPSARWRLSDIDPADLAELADLVMERIEGRVRGELERRGRRGIPGVF
ncbi:hypothetical protein [Jiangella sp. DSM 45060]|uniref:hypothetical protein n=1 Tax=Jiangella sp. DSM 45060 TaxID=1798224 RepID=UPI00087A9181|nr:hypothetical protein [Jiangella sp. DSM 45060]SDS70677.1 hypothetical protein SAMN04515669_1721 [Jiangella sp. DSM 45060]